MLYTFATPRSLVMRLQICDYCNSSCDHHVICENRLHGIMACRFHGHLANRDVRAWFHTNGFVRQNDFLEAHPEIAHIKINVPRTNGSTTAGGNLSEEPYQFLKKVEGVWMIRVVFLEPKAGIMNKYVKLQDLCKSGVPEEMIEEWLTTLDSFYKEDAELHARACAEGREKVNTDFPGIFNVPHNGGIVSAFIPFQVEMPYRQVPN